jgi:acyl-CoA synthetase (AMP-forming)/AMP-acid ligase II
VSRTELDPVSFLHRSATVHPERIAVIDGDRRWTYTELRERVNRAASALRGRGLERHDRVAALCPNVPALLELHHAVPAAGGVLVAINFRLSPDEIRYILEHSGARMLFVTAELEPLIVDPPAGLEIIRADVVMRGNNVMAGYFANEDATHEAFRGGWFHSGDLAVWHPDGAIELRDRGKDVIISGGENISSIEVEQAICAHTAVLECAVLAVPHDHWGERPKAFVTLKEGATAAEADIVAFCRERLAHYKCPDAVTFGPLPKTSTGKVQKFLLREPEWARRDRRIN